MNINEFKDKVKQLKKELPEMKREVKLGDIVYYYAGNDKETFPKVAIIVGIKTSKEALREKEELGHDSYVNLCILSSMGFMFRDSSFCKNNKNGHWNFKE